MTTPYDIRISSLRNRLLTIVGITPETVDTVLELLKPELSAFAEYENATNWMTECTSCARLLDSCHAETVRAEEAIKDLNRYEEEVIGEMNKKAIDAARTIAQLQEELAYARKTIDALNGKGLDEFIGSALSEAAERMENAGHNDDAVNFLYLLAGRQTRGFFTDDTPKEHT